MNILSVADLGYSESRNTSDLFSVVNESYLVLFDVEMEADTTLQFWKRAAVVSYFLCAERAGG